MARLTKAVLGELSGKIGSLVVRKINGKQFVSLRPDHYKKSKSTKAIYEKNKFSTVVKFAKIINAISQIKNVWQKSNMQGFSAYHKILKTNLKTVGSEKKLPDFTIFPIAKNNYKINISVTGSRLSISDDDKIFQTIDKNFANTLYILKALRQSETLKEDYYEIQSIPITIKSFNDNIFSIDFNQIFNSNENNLLTSVFHISIIFKLSSNKKIFWTDTCSFS